MAIRIPHATVASVLFAAALGGTGCSSRESAEAAAKPARDVSPVAPTAATGTVVDMPDLAPDTPVVTVNTQVLTRAAAQQMMGQMLRAQGIPEEQMPQAVAMLGERMQKQVVEQFVVTTLMRGEADRRQVKVSDAEVASVLSNLTQRLPPGMSIEDALTQSGKTLDDVRADIRGGESLRKVYEAETARVAAPTDEEVGAYYAANQKEFTTDEQVGARHILVACDQQAPAEKQTAAKAKADGLRKQLVDGADFAALAGENSDCPSKAKGGDLGMFERGRMAPAFEEAAFSQATNVIGEVVQTQFGYHIIQVTAHTAAGQQPLASVREEIREKMTEEGRRKAFDTFIEGLRTNATIVYAEAEIKTDAAPDVMTAPAPAP